MPLATKKLNYSYKQEGDDSMNKVEELQTLLRANIAKMTELINKKEEVEEKKKCPACKILAVIGIIAAVGAIAYGIYRFFAPDYLEDFDDDFDDEIFGEDELEDEEEVFEEEEN